MSRPSVGGGSPTADGPPGRSQPVRDRYESVAAAADPELALRQLDRLQEAASRVGIGEELAAAGPQAWRRLVTVLGASAALGDFLVAHPIQWRVLAEPQVELATPWPAGWCIESAAHSGVTDVAGLRVSYRRALLRIAADDLTGWCDLEQTMARLSTLADATLVAGLDLASDDAAPSLAVLALGKCGGQELNYVSDVDVILVVADGTELAPATGTAAQLINICGQVAWPVDLALRPEGASGPLVRTLSSHLAYYHRWAHTWEFQALLKARPAAGDLALGQRLWQQLQPLVWTATQREGAVADIRAMRGRIVDNVPRHQRDRELKRGPGGLRDIEFAVQLLQLVHGRVDESLRIPGTLPALRALVAGGYVRRNDGEALVEAYWFLRKVEHRLQLQRLRRTHLVPQQADVLRWLAHAMGYGTDPIAAFRADWVTHAAQVRRLHAKLLYRPLLEAVAKVPTESLRMSADSAHTRLDALGFADPAGALRHLQALTGGVSRAAAIQRTLLPVLLEDLANLPQPDRGLLAYRQVCDALRKASWFPRLLRDAGPVAQRLARVLGLSRWCADLLARDPEAVRLLADDAELVPRGGATLGAGFTAAAARHARARDAVGAVRSMRRRELVRIAMADVLAGGDLAPQQSLDVTAVGQALTDVTDATLAAALHVAGGALPQGLRFAVIGVGRLGGQEMSYASDADVLFVYDFCELDSGALAEQDAAAAAHRVAQRLRELLAEPTPDPPLSVDADLRPEGRQGPLVRSLAAYRQYYQRWSRVWESQALLRARFVCGDAALAQQFLAVADQLRYRPAGLSGDELVEIRRLKARVDSERLPRGADARAHTKLGRGSLSDVEWAVQVLQLCHGASVPGLRTTATLAALEAACEADLISAADAAVLSHAWTYAARVRNALTLVQGRQTDELPAHGPVLAGVARLVESGMSPGQLFDHYLKVTRRSRTVLERMLGA